MSVNMVVLQKDHGTDDVVQFLREAVRAPPAPSDVGLR